MKTKIIILCLIGVCTLFPGKSIANDDSAMKIGDPTEQIDNRFIGHWLVTLEGIECIYSLNPDGTYTFSQKGMPVTSKGTWQVTDNSIAWYENNEKTAKDIDLITGFYGSVFEVKRKDGSERRFQWTSKWDGEIIISYDRVGTDKIKLKYGKKEVSGFVTKRTADYIKFEREFTSGGSIYSGIPITYFKEDIAEIDGKPLEAGDPAPASDVYGRRLPLEENHVLAMARSDSKYSFSPDGRHVLYTLEEYSPEPDLAVLSSGGLWEVENTHDIKFRWSDSSRTFAFNGEKPRPRSSRISAFEPVRQYFIVRNHTLIPSNSEVVDLDFLPGSERLYIVKKDAFCVEDKCVSIPDDYKVLVHSSAPIKILQPAKFFDVPVYSYRKVINRGRFIVSISGDAPEGILAHGDGPIAFSPATHAVAYTDDIYIPPVFSKYLLPKGFRTGNIFVIWGNKKWGPFIQVHEMAFSPNGDHLAFWAKKTDQWESYVDGEVVFSEEPRPFEYIPASHDPVDGMPIPARYELTKPLTPLHQKGGGLFEADPLGKETPDDHVIARYGDLNVNAPSGGEDQGSVLILEVPKGKPVTRSKKISAVGLVDPASARFIEDGSKLVFGSLKTRGNSWYALQWNVVPVSFHMRPLAVIKNAALSVMKKEGVGLLVSDKPRLKVALTNPSAKKSISGVLQIRLMGDCRFCDDNKDDAGSSKYRKKEFSVELGASESRDLPLDLAVGEQNCKVDVLWQVTDSEGNDSENTLCTRLLLLDPKLSGLDQSTSSKKDSISSGDNKGLFDLHKNSEQISESNVTESKVSDDRLLMDAVKSGNVEEVQSLLNKGVDVNVRVETMDSPTPLMKASEGGNLEVVKLLVGKGANVNATDHSGETPLMYASRGGHLEIMKLLIEKGADVNAQEWYGHMSVLLLAFERGDLKTVKLLLDYGADVKTKDFHGETTLMYASRLNDLEIVKLLISKGTDVNASNIYGYTALMDACMYGFFEMVKLLIDTGADVNAKHPDGQTALMLAAESGYSNIMALLINKGADVKAKSWDGATILMSASKVKDLGVVKLMIDKGTYVNATDSHGGTALMAACRNGTLELVQLLIEKGADVNAKKDSYSDPTALFIALRRGDLGILKLLIKKGADMKAVDGDGWTALMIAMQEGHSEVIKLFQENDKSVGPNAHKNSVFGIFPKASGSTK